jgi:hypothetical protein
MGPRVTVVIDPNATFLHASDTHYVRPHVRSDLQER